MISSIAVALIFAAVATALFLPQRSQFPTGTIPSGALTVGQGALPYSRVLVIVAALVLVVLLTVLLRFTKLGKAVRAVAENPKAARLLGINVEAIYSFSFFLSSALGGAAG